MTPESRPRKLLTKSLHHTDVELIRVAGQIEHWIRFGIVAAHRQTGDGRRLVSFAPGCVFAVIRRLSNKFGTVAGRLDIVRTVRPGEPITTIPHVRPGGELLLTTHAWPKVQKILTVIEAVEALGIDPVEVAPDYWRHVHNRMSVNDKAGRYTRQRHQAWLLRREWQP